MHPFAKSFYETGSIELPDGSMIEAHSVVESAEYAFLESIIESLPTVNDTLEVGCAFGLSTLAIADSLARRNAEARHFVIDPNQDSEFGGVARQIIAFAGLKNVDFRTEGSEFVLPDLAKTRPSGFDLVFVDGWHSFDHTLLDLVYALRLLRLGGILVVDDCLLPGVARAVDTVLRFPSVEIASRLPRTERSPRLRISHALARVIPRPLAAWLLPQKLYDIVFPRALMPEMIAIRKTAEDERPWDWSP